MKPNYVILIISLIFLGQYSIAQDKSDENKDKINRAVEITNQVRQAIYQKVKKEDIKTLYLQTTGAIATESITQIEGESAPRETKSRQTIESGVSIELSDKAKQEIFSYNSDKNPAENYTKIQSLLNGEKFSQTMDIVIDGKVFDINAMLNAPYMPESAKKQMREAMEKAKPTRESIQKRVSEQLYPILLSSLWGDEKKFIYIGKAEAGDTRADILEIESDTERQTRWFFDEKTHLLLMITDEISKNGLSAKTTQYFSDYQLMDGLLVAKKINIETESSSEPREMGMIGQKMKVSSKGKTITETIIREFKINPKFKPETFTDKEIK